MYVRHAQGHTVWCQLGVKLVTFNFELARYQLGHWAPDLWGDIVYDPSMPPLTRSMSKSIFFRETGFSEI